MDNQLKAILISRIFPPRVGGSGRWFFEIYSRLPHGEYLICGGEHQAATAFDRHADLPILRVPLDMPDWGYFSFDGFQRYRRNARALRKLIEKRRPRALHSGSLLPDGWLGHLVAGRHDLQHWVYIHGEEITLAKASRQLKWMGQRVLSRAHGVIANSRNTQRLLIEYWGVDPAKIRILHPGVDCSRFVPAARNTRVRAHLSWGSRPVILTVGRLQARKGQDTMIRALPEIRAQVPDVLYAIVGGGEDRESLETLARQLGVQNHVLFHGEVDDELMVEAYQQCDLFALPNREIRGDIEGFGMVLLEAQACGRPVLAGRSGGTAETMIEGETGLLLDCNGPDELARHVPELLLDRARLDKMGAAGRRWVESRFDWPALAREAASIFG